MPPEKPYSDACERNREPILEVLRQYFADRRAVLEIGSGTGQHAVHFAAALPQLTWQASDLPERLPGMRAWFEEARLPNLPAPLALDVHGPWPAVQFDAVFTANTLHILSWEEVRTLFVALRTVLVPSGVLIVYGPFNYEGSYTSASNASFDVWLKEHSQRSGIRDFEAVDELARSIGLRLAEDRAMPAHNRTLVWRPSASIGPSDASDAARAQ